MKQWLAIQWYRLRIGLGRRILPPAVVPARVERMQNSAKIALDLATYVRKSGHLQTVNGRNPRAVDRIYRGLCEIKADLALGVLWGDQRP